MFFLISFWIKKKTNMHNSCRIISSHKKWEFQHQFWIAECTYICKTNRYKYKHLQVRTALQRKPKKLFNSNFYVLWAKLSNCHFVHPIFDQIDTGSVRGETWVALRKSHFWIVVEWQKKHLMPTAWTDTRHIRLVASLALSVVFRHSISLHLFALPEV